MTRSILFLAWIAVPLAAWILLKHKTPHALPLIGIAIALALFAVGLSFHIVSLAQSYSAGQNEAYQIGTYIISNGQTLHGLSVGYAMVAAFTAIILRFGNTSARHLMSSGFWLFHFGSTTIALQSTIAAAFMPRRYADYPSIFAMINRITFTGAVLCTLALTLLAVLALTALIQTLQRYKT